MCHGEAAGGYGSCCCDKEAQGMVAGTVQGSNDWPVGNSVGSVEPPLFPCRQEELLLCGSVSSSALDGDPRPHLLGPSCPPHLPTSTMVSLSHHCLCTAPNTALPNSNVTLNPCVNPSTGFPLFLDKSQIPPAPYGGPLPASQPLSHYLSPAALISPCDVPQDLCTRPFSDSSVFLSSHPASSSK